jgi:filamentous hemagglutinin
MPSKAALRIAREEDLGRPLTAAEVRRIEEDGITVAIDRNMHRDSRTYAGRNNSLKIDDAANLHVAIRNDLNVFIENAAARGLSEYQTMRTVAAILMQSRQRGLIR